MGRVRLCVLHQRAVNHVLMTHVEFTVLLCHTLCTLPNLCSPYTRILYSWLSLWSKSKGAVLKLSADSVPAVHAEASLTTCAAQRAVLAMPAGGSIHQSTNYAKVT